MDLGSSLDVWRVLGVGLVGAWLGAVLALTRRPETPTSRALRGLALCAALWSAGDLVAGMARDLFWKQVGVAILYTGAIFLPPLWWRLSLGWAEERGLAPALDVRRWTRGPLAFAGVMWLAMLTNPWHGRFLEPVVGGRNVYGPLWWLMAVPNYALIVGVLVLELRVQRRTRTPWARRQAAFMIAASGLTLVANWLYVFRLGPVSNATLPVLALAAVILGVGMLRQGLFGVLPVALPVIASHDPDGLGVVRPGGWLVHANPRARALLAPVGLREGASLPQALAPQLLHPDGQRVAQFGSDWVELWWRSVLEPGGALYRYGADGARWLRMSAQPVRGRGGRVLAHCLRIHDTTAELLAEAEARRARSLESVADLARGVAHDFHNLLAVIMGNAELLLDQLPAAPELQRKLHRILRSSEQAADLASQLQVYAGAKEPARVPLDLSQVTRDVFEVLDTQVFATPRGCAFDARMELAPEPLIIEADATQVRQLVLNLLVNACDALGEEGGEIRAHTGRVWLDPAKAENMVLGRDSRPAQYAFLRVSDTGAGIDPATQERIFEPFFSTKGKQRGVGLSTVFGVARSHGALLGLQSRVGHGTTFSVYFPCAESDLRAQPRSASRMARSSRGTSGPMGP
jgi:signal transduction histidine kinase